MRRIENSTSPITIFTNVTDYLVNEYGVSLTDAVHSLINTEKARIKKFESNKLEFNHVLDNIP